MDLFSGEKAANAGEMGITLGITRPKEENYTISASRLAGSNYDCAHKFSDNQ
jgi:hypothetical protein